MPQGDVPDFQARVSFLVGRDLLPAEIRPDPDTAVSCVYFHLFFLLVYAICVPNLAC